MYVSYRNNRVRTCFIAECAIVIGDRLISVNNSSDIEVRRVHNGEMAHTIPGIGIIWRMSPVAGHSALLVTGGMNGNVHLWDIDKGEHQSMNIGMCVQESTCAES